jgi:hypothetical protein
MKKITFYIILSYLLGTYSTFAQQYGTGCLFDSARYENIPLTAPLVRGNYNLPSSISLKAYCPTPKDQGNTGTCTAWSTTYASRTILYAQKKALKDVKEVDENAFSPSYVYNQIRMTNDCSYGAYISDALDLLKTQGCVSYKEFGYECNKSVTDKDKKKAKDFIIKDYKRLFAYDGTGKVPLINIKKSLSEGKPVTISMRCWGSLEKAKDVWNPPADPTKDISKGYHAVTVIGYDDNKFGGAFEIMNSWGTDWGNNGFVWVRYNDFQKNCMEAYEVAENSVANNVVSQKDGLAGEIVFKQDNGKVMETTFQTQSYKMKNPYYSGTMFQFFVTHNEPVYLYVVGTDLTGKCTLLFPYNKRISPFLSYRTGTVAFPDEDHFVRLDNQKGTDYICAFFSKYPVKIEEIMAKMEQQKNLPIQDKVYKALGINKIDGVEYFKLGGKTGFKVNKYFAVGSVVPLIVEVEHK